MCPVWRFVPKDMRKGGTSLSQGSHWLRWLFGQQTWSGEGVDSPRSSSRTVFMWEMNPCTPGFWQALILGHCYLHKRPKGLDKLLECGRWRSSRETWMSRIDPWSPWSRVRMTVKGTQELRGDTSSPGQVWGPRTLPKMGMDLGSSVHVCLLSEGAPAPVRIWDYTSVWGLAGGGVVAW